MILEKEREHRGSRDRGTLWFYIKLTEIKLVISNPLFAHLRKRGIHITLWNVNNEETRAKAFGLYPNIDALGTDCPSKMAKMIRENENMYL